MRRGREHRRSGLLDQQHLVRVPNPPPPASHWVLVVFLPIHVLRVCVRGSSYINYPGVTAWRMAMVSLTLGPYFQACGTDIALSMSACRCAAHCFRWAAIVRSNSSLQVGPLRCFGMIDE